MRGRAVAGALFAGAIAGLLNWVTYRRARAAERLYGPAGDFLVVHGVRLHYVDRGSGPAVVLLHGSDGSVDDFAAVIDALAGRFRVVAFDRPGHGWSGIRSGVVNTPARQITLLRAAVHRLGLGRVILAGHSWSGVLLAGMAVQHPSELAGIVPICATLYPPVVRPPSLETLAVRLLLFVPRIPLAGLPLVSTFTPLVKHLVLGWSLRQAFAPRPVPPAYARRASAMWLRWPAMVRALAEENSSDVACLRELAPRYGTLDLPVVVLAGSDDRVVSVRENAARFSRDAHDSVLQTVPGAGHELPVSDPEAVCAAIVRCADIASRRGLAEISLPARSEPARARELVFRYGWNVTAYQILRPDVEHWFSADGGAVVGFVSHFGTRVAVGAPICEEARLAEVAEEFEASAALSGERVCWFAAGTRLEEPLTARGDHSAIVIGAQPLWRPERWADIVRRNSSLRGQLNRARNKGVSVEERTAEQVGADEDIRRCQREWLDSRGLPTLRFVTEPVELDRLEDRRAFVALRGGRAIGLLLATPVPKRDGWLIEQIVRGNDAPNGVSELLVDACMRALGESGARIVTFGLAPLSLRADARLAHGDSPLPIVRLLFAWMRAHGRRFYNFEGLDAFKAKFRPDAWEPVYAVANERPFKLRTLYAIACAFSGGPPAATVLSALWDAARREADSLRERLKPTSTVRKNS